MPPRKHQKLSINSENQPGIQLEKKRRTRGASLMKSIAKGIGEGIRHSIRLNKKGQPIGENRAKLFTYIGTTAKKWVPITLDNWTLVSEEEKDAIWEDVLDGFILPIELKSWVLKKAGVLWRQFKKDLGKYHMVDKKTGEIRTKPPAIYDKYITKDQWTEFLQIRLSKEFKAKSEKFRELSRLNDYTYRASRKGYAVLEDDYKIEHNMDPDSEVSRAILWMKAREKKSGDYDEKSQTVIEKLHRYMEQEASGELVTTGQKDVLALALGKPEHPGRVRGVGQDVVISQYWPRSSKGASSSKETEAREAVISELKDQMNVMKSTFTEKIEALELVIHKLIEERQTLKEGKPSQEMHVLSTPKPQDPCVQSGKASCSIPKKAPTESNKSEWQSCEIFWPDLKQAVARGKVHHSAISTGVLHTQALEGGYLRVEVTTVIKGDVVMPRPIDDVHILRDAVGYFIAWPDHLVIPIEDSERPKTEALKEKAKVNTLTNESVIGPTEIESEASVLENYKWLLEDFNGNNVRKIKVAAEIFQYEHPELEIGKEEIERWLDKKEIGASHVILYIRNLFDNHSKVVKDMFRFLCPTQISPLGQSIEQRAAYIANAMDGDVKDKIFIAPYYFRYHWVLILLNPHLGHAYWIDPRQEKVEKDAESLVALSYKLKYTKLGRKTPRKQTLWHCIKCPCQQNKVDSGYYVLKFMKDVLLFQKRSLIIPVKWYDDKTTCKDGDIDELRKELLDYFLTLL